MHDEELFERRSRTIIENWKNGNKSDAYTIFKNLPPSQMLRVALTRWSANEAFALIRFLEEKEIRNE